MVIVGCCFSEGVYDLWLKMGGLRNEKCGDVCSWRCSCFDIDLGCWFMSGDTFSHHKSAGVCDSNCLGQLDMVGCAAHGHILRRHYGKILQDVSDRGSVAELGRHMSGTAPFHHLVTWVGCFDDMCDCHGEAKRLALFTVRLPRCISR